jgi:glycosyltransferase involved in cell wall biosynthesis
LPLPSADRQRSFAIVANGFSDGPAQALRDFLVESGADVFAVAHPLSAEDGGRHVVSRFVSGSRQRARTVRIPLRPPLSFAVDPLIPLLPPRVDAWFGFNPLACSRGLLARAQRRARFVALWSVDFVPDRFGRNSVATRLYDRLDRLCCIRADARIELSKTAREERRRRHALPEGAGAAHIVPMGAWLKRIETAQPESFERKRVVYLGHLVPRQGVGMLLDALAVLHRRGEPIGADIIGTGPLERELRERARELELGDGVRFHGFVPDHRDVERILAGSSLAVAPYRPGDDSFTRYADPGKLKAYLAAGLPIVLTDVPPNARELERSAGAELVAYEAHALADAISAGLASVEAWQRRSVAARTYAGQFDWATLLPDLMRKLGLSF